MHRYSMPCQSQHVTLCETCTRHLSRGHANLHMSATVKASNSSCNVCSTLLHQGQDVEFGQMTTWWMKKRREVRIVMMWGMATHKQRRNQSLTMWRRKRDWKTSMCRCAWPERTCKTFYSATSTWRSFAGDGIQPRWARRCWQDREKHQPLGRVVVASPRSFVAEFYKDASYCHVITAM